MSSSKAKPSSPGAGHRIPASSPALPPRLAGAVWVLVPLLVVATGILWTLASPFRTLPFVWVVVYVPLFLALDLVLRTAPPVFWRRWMRVFLCTYPAGLIFGGLTGDWVVNTAYVYGGLPKVMAYLASVLGYGSLHGLETFFLLGLPFALTWRRPALAVALVTLWATVFQLYVPRFLFWTYGQLMIQDPALVQFANILGSGGLNLIYLPLQLVLYGWLRTLYAPAELSRRHLVWASLTLAVVFAAAYGYGRSYMSSMAERAARGPQVQLVGLQPDFSLKALASNPDLSPSNRKQSISALLSDSATALARIERQPDVPTLLLWPESVYPAPYFYAPGLRAVVERFVREEDTALILATTDGRLTLEADGQVERSEYGAAVYLGPDGIPQGIYHKIALIPFGETIPFGDVIPWYRAALRAWIPQISEFTPGREYTVFKLSNGVGVAPMICFDASVEEVALGMARHGARLGVVLANLAWFGRTTVTDQFSWFARFRAIENRMPILFLSQNGQSFLIDPTGRDASPRLSQFQSGVISPRVSIPQGRSIYTRAAPWIARLYALALIVVAGYGFWTERHR